MASELHVDAIKHSGGTSALTINSSGSVNIPGSVIQLVTNTTSTITTVGTTTYTDSGLTCQITPKFSSSKIFIVVSQHFRIRHASQDTGMGWKIFRDSTNVKSSNVNYALYIYEESSDGVDWRGWQTWNYLDSPSTTSQITYKTQISRYASSGTATLRAQDNNNPSTMTLMEIAQ